MIDRSNRPHPNATANGSAGCVTRREGATCADDHADDAQGKGFPDRDATDLSDPHEPPLWVAYVALAFAIAAPFFLVGLSHLT